jgi:hypothetical protein
MSITQPGIYEMTAAEYHADPCPQPSLSSGIGRTLLRQSAMHAYAGHPKLGGCARTPSAAMEAGSVIHKLLLGRGDHIEIVEAEDWRTKAAKDARDRIRERGNIPMLHGDYADMESAASAMRRQINAHPDAAFLNKPGCSEAVVIWQEQGIWCRAMVDRLPDDPRLPIGDVKTTGKSAAPEDFSRTIERDYAFQAAFYMRGVAAVRGIMPFEMRFIVAEQNPPHGVSVMVAAPSLMMIAGAEVERAIRRWGECLRSGEWPGYPQKIAYVEASPWRAALEEERAQLDEWEQEAA